MDNVSNLNQKTGHKKILESDFRTVILILMLISIFSLAIRSALNTWLYHPIALISLYDLISFVTFPLLFQVFNYDNTNRWKLLSISNIFLTLIILALTLIIDFQFVFYILCLYTVPLQLKKISTSHMDDVRKFYKKRLILFITILILNQLISNLVFLGNWSNTMLKQDYMAR